MELPRIFATAELAALGVGANTIRTLVRGGRLIRLRRGGYAWPADCGPDDVLRSADPIPEPTCRASDDPASDPGWARQPEPLPEEGTRAAPSLDMDAPLPVDPEAVVASPGEALGPGRYAPGEAELQHLKEIVATAREIDEGTLFCQVSAGVLHGLPLPPGSLGLVHLLRPGSGSGHRTRRAFHHRARITARDRTTIAGLLSTGLARTAVDLARTLSFRDGLAVVDAVLARGVRKEELFSRLTRHPGNLRARALIELGNRRSESPGESRCRATMALAGIPEPVCQFKIVLRSGRVVWADYGWPDLGLVGEFDGLTKYGRLLKPGETATRAIGRERRRETEIRDTGVWVTRWITNDCYDLDQFRRGFNDAARAATSFRAA
ncbi:type IV toxin-antitoxin system AbiEi family antitoxin domain-containing protein [Enemella evansiae]|uniref:type IV toxin-antitoxin system AbiEi family antitoxin domain-containing protein n=1 Tax=Enemella evansiae TaxID=2016499 RepID=UPI001061D2AB|nr:type IV toxin-antitoxin system AbiEi family antitoxin domain-containing protein [Enemella evansiae]TDO92785.1 putative AbiEi antitoxin of type IV toxin-antitoxin system [Enemella evansiae]